MPSTVFNWSTIRTLNGMQSDAFEELCCQLARAESPQVGAEFTRVGNPDAGVECYWTLSNGNEWGWQAKYFLQSLTNGQWDQIDHSVKTALEKRPKLVKYFVCLPIGRPDAHIKGRQSMMDKWNNRVARWEGWAAAKGMSVEFVYWGNHDLTTRLTEDRHRGRVFFFFNQEYFTTDWLKGRLDEAISDAGKRYLPLLNVDLPIADVFDGVGRTEAFQHRLSEQLVEFEDAFRIGTFTKDDPDLKGIVDELFKMKQTMGAAVANLVYLSRGPDQLLFEGIIQFGYELIETAEKYVDSLRDLENQERRKLKGEDTPSDQQHNLDKYRSQRSALYRIAGATQTLIRFLESAEAESANTGALLITGDAGQGKTHLLCDVAEKRAEIGLPTILLHGNHFNSGDPWAQILTTLHVRGERDEFLGALDALGEAKGHRVLLMIDALNESQDKSMWKNHLSGMLTALERFPWVGIVVSFRSTYRTTILPEGLDETVLVEIIHTGFSEVPQEAINKYFEYFGLNAPRIPTLLPDFTNPLFLYTFCQAIRNSGAREIPSGVNGIHQLLKYYIASVDKILAPALGYDERNQLVWKASLGLAKKLAEEDVSWIDVDTAKSILDSLHPGTNYQESLYFHMVDQGVIIEDAYQWDKTTIKHIVRFTYERFSDHLVAEYLLDTYLDEANPQAAFLPNGKIGNRFPDEARSSWKRGLIEALSIQLPERVEQEFFQVAPHARSFGAVRSAFVASLIWRNPANLDFENARSYVNSVVINHRDTHDEFVNALLTISSNPDHPFNATLLHQHLSKFGIAERDAWWTIFLQENYYEGYPISRIVDWALLPMDKSEVSNETIRLLAVTLCWFLTSTNRALRDRTTKALVNLLTPRIAVLREVLKDFREVNDPYVAERVYAVAYGCSLRSNDNENIKVLAQDVYNTVFKNGSPPPHILLRDYARGVIEVALHRGLKLRLSKKKIRPPYSSEWPNDIPSADDLKKLVELKDNTPRTERGLYKVYNSLLGWIGDFGKYVVGSRQPWSSTPLSEEWKPSLREKYDKFITSLTKRQELLWSEFQQVRFTGIRFLPDTNEEDDLSDTPSVEEISAVEEKFLKSLRTKKRQAYEDIVVRYFEALPSQDDRRMSSDLVSRFIFRRVIEMGYTNERFGEFDSGYSIHRGESARIERIGKKYQWVGYHEAIARLSDNFYMMPEYGDSGPITYDGPWGLNVRDIDPSHTLVSTSPRLYGEGHTDEWLAPVGYDWSSNPMTQDWRLRKDDFPDTAPLLKVSDPVDGADYYALEANFEWVEPHLPHEARKQKPDRRIWYQLRSYLVAEENSDDLFQWAKSKNIYGRWMPESGNLGQMYLGEYPWANSYAARNTPYYGHKGWTDETNYHTLPTRVRITVENYHNAANDYDNSVGEGVSCMLPNPEIIEGMGLRWHPDNSQWEDKNGLCIVFDPALKGHHYQGLLVRKDMFDQYLSNNGYSLIWTVMGEKEEYIDMPISPSRWVEYSEVYLLKDGNPLGSRKFYEQPDSGR